MEANDNNSEIPGSVNYPSLSQENIQEIVASDNNENLTQPQQAPQTDVSGRLEVIHIPESDFDFWQVNNYKRTVRRVDDGAKLCDDFTKMVNERAEIESLYASKLQGWSRKWCDVLAKGPEYGSCKNSWSNIITEASDVAQLHTDLHGSLMSQIHDSITAWKSANYHKALLSWKETKNAEDGFSKAQKPYAKKYDEVAKCKKSYYGACRARDQAEILYSSADPNTMKEEQIKKLKDKVTKCEGDVTTTRERYEESIRDITNYNPKYKEDMCYVFDKLQTFEESRKVFFKQTMQNLCQALTVEKYFQRYSQIYNKLSNEFSKTEPSADVAWWAANYGTNMPIKWLKFEEYVANAENEHESTQGQQSSSDGNSETSKKAKSAVCTTL